MSPYRRRCWAGQPSDELAWTARGAGVVGAARHGGLDRRDFAMQPVQKHLFELGKEFAPPSPRCPPPRPRPGGQPRDRPLPRHRESAAAALHLPPAGSGRLARVRRRPDSRASAAARCHCGQSGCSPRVDRTALAPTMPGGTATRRAARGAVQKFPTCSEFSPRCEKAERLTGISDGAERAVPAA